MSLEGGQQAERGPARVQIFRSKSENMKPKGRTEEARFGRRRHSHCNCPSAGRAGGWPRAKGPKVRLKNKNMTEEGLMERMDGLPQRGGNS